MAYNVQLADRVREHISRIPDIDVEEKQMFSGLAFIINGKMCINISGENLMCRFDPDLTPNLAEKAGFLPMIMKGKELRGYCYVEPSGIRTEKDFEFWISLCMDFNKRAKISRKRKS